ncbi:hypothetical protein RHS01_04101 [Rhizoctonia solani]|uniref:Uncharacterized protein n=1 Tax=Rhizoctonia solani TaxID=456999 RepID=A0A8H7IIA3_9AGAM|nr:hypothetical protein RHS01_04101 [Rhizoctonia solani]
MPFSVLVEGAITIALGLAGFYFLPGSIEKNKFLDEREKMIAVRRLMEDEDNGNTAGPKRFKATHGGEPSRT